MKNTLTTFFLILSLSGCSHQNAFTKFNLETEEELSFSSQQDTPIYKNKEVAGAFSAVYLNEVKPDIYNNKEYFIVSIYLKEKEDLENFDKYKEIKKEIENLKQIESTENIDIEENKGLNIILNNSNPLTIEPLAEEFKKYIAINAPWNYYYMVIFEESVENKLNLSLKGKTIETKKLIFTKNEE